MADQRREPLFLTVFPAGEKSGRRYLGRERVFSAAGGFPARPPFQDLTEVLESIKAALEQAGGVRADYVRTVESGAVIEYVVTLAGDKGPRLALRLWPVFFTAAPRIEYRFHLDDPDLRRAVEPYLAACARATGAALKEKT